MLGGEGLGRCGSFQSDTQDFHHNARLLVLGTLRALLDYLALESNDASTNGGRLNVSVDDGERDWLT